MKKTIQKIAFLFLSFFTFFPLATAKDLLPPFVIETSNRPISVAPGESFSYAVHFKIPQNHYLYAEKTSVQWQNTADLEFLRSERPDPRRHFDRFSQKDVPVYFDDFTETVFFRVPEKASLGKRTLEATVRYQGCSGELCFRPLKQKISVDVAVVGTGALRDSAPTSSGSFLSLLREHNPERLLSQGRGPLLLLAFFGGILTSLTPCVLPIIPLTLAFIGASRSSRGSWRRVSLLVSGMVLMYAVLGFLAATLGLKLGFLFQSPYFVLATALFFLLFALGLLGVISYQMPPRLQARLGSVGGKSGGGAFLAGLTIGLIASPCVGPMIAPLLLIAAQSRDRFYGFSLLLVYGIGMGLLFFVLASSWAQLNRKLKAGSWTLFLKRSLGVLLLLPAFYYGSVFFKTSFSLTRDSLWVYQLEPGLAAARESGKPILIDFYATWCPPCLEIEKKTFSDAQVRELAKRFVMLKIDCSVDDANCQAATERFTVVGWPTILFLDSQGQVMEGLQWVGGFADRERMLRLMHSALERNAPQ